MTRRIKRASGVSAKCSWPALAHYGCFVYDCQCRCHAAAAWRRSSNGYKPMQEVLWDKFDKFTPCASVRRVASMQRGQ